jgi:STE24 endopeptidase
MIFIVITAVLIAFSYDTPADLSRLTPPRVALTAMACSIGIAWGLAEAFARWTARQLTKPDANRATVMLRYQRMRWLHAGVLLGSYAGLIHGFDWPGVIRATWGLDRWVLVDDLLVLLPIVLGLLLASLAQFRVDELLRVQMESMSLHPPRWRSRWYHVDFQMRHSLGIVLVPLLTLVSIQDAVGIWFEGSPVRPTLELAAAIGGLACILVFVPLLLRVLWRAEPLAPGPLRTRLENLSRRLNFRSSDILVWNTHGAVINAAVAGILPWPRYVLLSDALLTHLTHDEIQAVFGHEVGHVRHHHLWYFIAFLKGAILFLMLAIAGITPLVERLVGSVAATEVFSVARGLILPLACLGVYFGLFFGFLSRRFERQADIFGCRAVSCASSACPDGHSSADVSSGDPPLCPAGIEIFVRALEKVAVLNGAMRDARSWRHFSIAKRVAFLRKLAERPDVERSFQRFVFALKILVLVALVGGAWYALRQSPESAPQSTHRRATVTSS